jgi:signal transduction histidine kinase
MTSMTGQPFHRLELSRTKETGGVGLGVTVARFIIRAHGGDVLLADAASGGLSVTVTLPAATR